MPSNSILARSPHWRRRLRYKLFACIRANSVFGPLRTEHGLAGRIPSRSRRHRFFSRSFPGGRDGGDRGSCSDHGVARGVGDALHPDIKGAARWGAGKWTLEVARRLDAEHPNVSIGSNTRMWAAVFDHAQTHHTRHIRPVCLELQR
jgi:hypothetical protein